MRRRRQSATANIPPTHTRCRAPRDRGPSHRPRTGISAGAARPGEVLCWPAASPPGRWRWPTAAAGCGNGRHDPCASRRLVRARLLPQLPERAGDPWRAPAWEEAPLRPAAAAAEGGRLSCGRLPNRQGSLQMPPCTGSGVRSARRFGTAAGWGLPRGAPQVVRFGRACGGGGRAATGGQERPRAHCAQGGGFLMTHNGHPALPGALNVNALGTTHNAAHAVHIALLWPPP